MMDEGRWVTTVDPDTELWAAARVVAMHGRGGKCGVCDRDGCRLLSWAEGLRLSWAEGLRQEVRDSQED